MRNNDVVVLENRVDADWNIHLHVMAAKQDDLQGWVDEHYPEHPFELAVDELRMWHIRALWPARNLVELQIPLTPFDVVRWPVVAWRVGAGERVSEAMVEAGTIFALSTGRDPMFAFTRRMPLQAEEFVDVKGISLVQADWVPNGFLAVGRGGMQRKG